MHEKIKFLKKQSNLMQKLLKVQYFMNEMHEYEIKSFFFKKKHLNSIQIFQKQVFQPIVLKNSNIKHILHQNQGTFNLGWPQQDHTQYNVPSLAKSNLCSVWN